MKSRAKLAAFRILALREEFSNKEISDAIALINGGFLSTGADSTSDRSPQSVSRRSVVPRHESPVMKDLFERDPVRYRLLREIDVSIRSGRILPRLQDIRRIGTSIGKNFHAGKSKREAIPRLMAWLMELPTAKIEEMYNAWKHEHESDSGTGDGYQDLARFLIDRGGNRPSTVNSVRQSRNHGKSSSVFEGGDPPIPQ